MVAPRDRIPPKGKFQKVNLRIRSRIWYQIRVVDGVTYGIIYPTIYGTINLTRSCTGSGTGSGTRSGNGFSNLPFEIYLLGVPEARNVVQDLRSASRLRARTNSRAGADLGDLLHPEEQPSGEACNLESLPRPLQAGNGQRPWRDVSGHQGLNRGMTREFMDLWSPSAAPHWCGFHSGGWCHIWDHISYHIWHHKSHHEYRIWYWIWYQIRDRISVSTFGCPPLPVSEK